MKKRNVTDSAIYAIEETERFLTNLIKRLTPMVAPIGPAMIFGYNYAHSAELAGISSRVSFLAAFAVAWGLEGVGMQAFSTLVRNIKRKEGFNIFLGIVSVLGYGLIGIATVMLEGVTLNMKVLTAIAFAITFLSYMSKSLMEDDLEVKEQEEYEMQREREAKEREDEYNREMERKEQEAKMEQDRLEKERQFELEKLRVRADVAIKKSNQMAPAYPQMAVAQATVPAPPPVVQKKKPQWKNLSDEERTALKLAIAGMDKSDAKKVIESKYPGLSSRSYSNWYEYAVAWKGGE